MADDTREKLLSLGADPALATAVSGVNDDGTAYSGILVHVSITTSLPPAMTATPVASGTAGAQGIAAAANLRLMGYSVRESHATTPDDASLVLRHGTTDADPSLAFVEVGGDQSLTVWFGDSGIAVPNGIFIDRVSGTTEIVLYTKVSA